MDWSEGRRRTGFTLVELLIVITILAVLAAIAIPRFMSSSDRTRQAASDSNLKLLRNAVQTFYADCGAYPNGLTSLTQTAAPIKGLAKDGSVKTIPTGSWHGPYLTSVPVDDVTQQDFAYSTTAPTVGDVSPPSGSVSVAVGP